ncbi:lactonase family protein [Legionella drancourtii]|uniref:lactonase family protein n=1 Tax=Legionella drancourtii TaxID=168933 RepID=UPI0001B022C2|nr:beta-propeller fold lactonase family protein [Legionella drancourtii]
MSNRVVLSLLLLFSTPIMASDEAISLLQKKGASANEVELVVNAKGQSSGICSSAFQNCTIRIGTTSCLNPPGTVTITHNSKISAKNITAASADSNFLNFVVQNNGCPTSLSPGANCSISFITNTSTAFLVPNVSVKGSNTNATFFDINAIQCPKTGNLIPVPASPFATGLHPSDMAVSPNSQFLYVTDSNGTVTGYLINASTGVLTTIAGSPFAAGSYPTAIAVSPDGLRVYVANSGSSDITAYNINQSTGALSQFNTFAAGSGPSAIAISPNGKFVYVTNANGNNIYAYTLNATTGVLTDVGHFAVGSQPDGIAVSPNNEFVYAVNRNGYTISAFTIDATTGLLTPIAGSPFATGTYPTRIIVSPNGLFVYVAANNGPGYQYDDSIWIYAIDTGSGALTDVSPVPIITGADGIAIDPDNLFAYATHYQDNTVGSDSIDAGTGALTVTANSPFATGDGPTAVVVTPNGNFVYVINYNDSTVSGYAAE